MKKINTSPISGMQELLPGAQASFDKMKSDIVDTYHSHGFMNIETPVIDRCEILLAKAGGDTEKQIYKVVKTTESADEADQALRFDHTVPLARYVVQHENDLAFPFKVSQVGRNYRGERAQKGRFREFYQCDVDIVGRGNLPLYYDADVISTLLDTFRRFKLKASILVRINNRKVLNGLLREYNLDSRTKEISNIIDHIEKVPLSTTKETLLELGIGEERASQILDFTKICGPHNEAIKALNSLGINDDEFEQGVAELDEVVRLLELDGYKKEVTIDMKIVRGLDYYTGTVFEFNLPEYPGIGSVCGGGRYENLAGYFTDQKLPGVGGSIGLTRLFYILKENNLIEDSSDKPVEYAVVPITDNELEFAMKVARDLRKDGVIVTIVGGGKRLGDKMKYASNIAKKGIVIGEAEAESGKYRVKVFN